MPRSARIIVSAEFVASGAVVPVVGISPSVRSNSQVVWISPGITTGLDGCGAVAPVLGISPARTMPESTHAREIAKARRLIVCFSFEDASQLARKQHSVNTYGAIDT